MHLSDYQMKYRNVKPSKPNCYFTEDSYKKRLRPMYAYNKRWFSLVIFFLFKLGKQNSKMYFFAKHVLELSKLWHLKGEIELFSKMWAENEKK